MQNFNSPASTQTDLDKFLTKFQVNYRIFLRKSPNFPILKKNPNRASQKTSFTKIEAILAFLQKFQKGF
jgi:hypothetical protein